MSVFCVQAAFAQEDALKDYWPSGNIRSDEPLVDGKREGIGIYTHDNGELYSEIPWRKGQKHGKFTLYRDDGSKEQELSYINGKKQGQFRWFNPQGILTADLYYENDKLHSLNKWYYDNGQLEVLAHYRYDELDGAIKRYSKDGILVSEGVYEKGTLVSGTDGDTQSDGEDDIMSIIFEVIIPIIVWILIIVFGRKKKKPGEPKKKVSFLEQMAEAKKEFDKLKAVQAKDTFEGERVPDSVKQPANVAPLHVSGFEQSTIDDPTPLLKRQYKIACLIWLGALFSVGIYGFACYVFTHSQGAGLMRDEDVRLYKNIFLGVSVACLVFAKPLESLILEGRSDRAGHMPVKRDPSVLVGKLFAATIVVLGLCDVPALLGLVLACMTFQMNEFYLFGGISIAALLMSFPRYDEWEYWVNNRLVGF